MCLKLNEKQLSPDDPSRPHCASLDMVQLFRGSSTNAKHSRLDCCLYRLEVWLASLKDRGKPMIFLSSLHLGIHMHIYDHTQKDYNTIWIYLQSRNMRNNLCIYLLKWYAVDGCSKKRKTGSWSQNDSKSGRLTEDPFLLAFELLYPIAHILDQVNSSFLHAKLFKDNLLFLPWCQSLSIVQVMWCGCGHSLM